MSDFVRCPNCSSLIVRGSNCQCGVYRQTSGPQPDPKAAVETYREGWVAGCSNHHDLLKQLRAKDARIAELERSQCPETCHPQTTGRCELIAERDRLRAEVDDARQNAARTCDLLRDERDDARAEGETLKKNLADAQGDCAAEVEACRRLEAQAARMREALQDTQSLVGNIHRYIEYVSPPLHQLITALQERVRKALAETDAGALPEREESGGNDAQAGEILPHGKDGGETHLPAPSVVHLSPPGWFVRGFDAWVCGAPAYSHEEGVVEIANVTCPECLRRGGETPGGSDG